MVISLSVLWFIRTAKAILFWIYLWQLKDYHIGRFIDHFRTTKGKGLLIDRLNFLKLFLIFSILFTFCLGLLVKTDISFFSSLIVFFTFFLYGAETFKAVNDFFGKKLKIPILTKKTLFLIAFGILIEILFLFILYRSQQYIYALAGRMESLRMVDTYNTAGDSIVPVGLIFFDIFISLIVSGIVLLFQPFAVFGRHLIIQKARRKRDQFKRLIVIGITGSYGKTSTKEFLAYILSKKFNVLKTKEHQNSEVGISNCILQELKPEHQVFVCEMGAYNKGGIKLLASIAKPTIGVLTGINEQHMATFGSQENIIKAKYELIESLPTNGVAFFNAKNKYCVEFYNKTSIKKILYGQTASFRGEENILGAMAVAKELGMTDEEISGAVEEINATFPGAKIQKAKDGFTVIEATYSANPDGVMAALEYLQKQPGKKILVMPCLIELGKASKEVHKRIGEKIAEVCDLAIITTKDRFEDIVEGALLRQGYGGREIQDDRLVFLENPKEIVEKIKSTTSSGDVVLLEGRVPSPLLELLT